jgi:hypothetical protein
MEDTTIIQTSPRIGVEEAETVARSYSISKFVPERDQRVARVKILSVSIRMVGSIPMYEVRTQISVKRSWLSPEETIGKRTIRVNGDDGRVLGWE